MVDRKLAEHTVQTLWGLHGDAKSDLAANRSLTPFLLVAGFVRPHNPWIVPTRLWRRYGSDTRLAVAASKAHPPSRRTTGTPGCDGHGRYVLQEGGPTARALPLETQREARRAYYAAVTHVDEQVGAVLRALNDTGFTSSTLVVINGDHGPADLASNSEYQ
jgi:arylsulfatase A-like enzyme